MAGSVQKFIWCIVLLLECRAINTYYINEYGLTIGGYQYYDNVGYYKFYSYPSTWGHAWKQCNDDGAHLVVIDSDEEHRVIWNMVKQSKKDVFIGIHDLFLEGLFLTVTGKPLVPSSYNKWYKNEPNNYGDQDCGLMATNGEIWDGKCIKRYNFICEFELGLLPK